MKFFVSRQLEWPDGNLLVEVAVGGLDYCNPGMLGVRWKELGEGQEFENPVEAAEAAIKIRNAWKAVEVEEIEIAFGATGGMTLSLPRMRDTELLAKAQEVYEGLPKCAECSGLLGEEKWAHELVVDDERFCREFCCDENYAKMSRDNEEENV